jgi:hypothetical protein
MRRDRHLHGRASTHRPVERFDGHPEHARPHQKQPRRLVGKTLLLGFEGHPAGTGRAANAAPKT